MAAKTFSSTFFSGVSPLIPSLLSACSELLATSPAGGAEMPSFLNAELAAFSEASATPLTTALCISLPMAEFAALTRLSFVAFSITFY